MTAFFPVIYMVGSQVIIVGVILSFDDHVFKRKSVILRAEKGTVIQIGRLSIEMFSITLPYILIYIYIGSSILASGDLAQKPLSFTEM